MKSLLIFVLLVLKCMHTNIKVATIAIKCTGTCMCKKDEMYESHPRWFLVIASYICLWP